MGELNQKSIDNRFIAALCLAFVVGMLGMAYASVPLYQWFCQVTGYGGTTKRVEQNSQIILDKTINVRFDGNVAHDLPWEFKPLNRQIQIKIGETAEIAYEAKNIAQYTTLGQAGFNVTPHAAGAYFNKVECFCFTETKLAPDEVINMPVVFFIDPEIVDAPELKNINTITLSYSFHSIETGS